MYVPNSEVFIGWMILSDCFSHGVMCTLGHYKAIQASIVNLLACFKQQTNHKTTRMDAKWSGTTMYWDFNISEWRTQMLDHDRGPVKH